MGLFSQKFKKIEAQNVGVESQEQPQVPKVIEPKMPTPMAIAEISKAVIAGMNQQQVEEEPQLPTITKKQKNDYEDKFKKKLEELKVKRMVIDGIVEFLEGI